MLFHPFDFPIWSWGNVIKIPSTWENHFLHFGFLSLYALQVYQPPAPVVGVAVGLATGTVGVGVAPVVGLAVGLGEAGIGVGVMPLVGFGVPVGLVAGTVGVVDAPAAGAVFVPAAGVVF